MRTFTPLKGLEIRSSPIEGRGCFTTRAIKSGQKILEYTGKRLRVQEANLLYHNRRSTYLFGLADRNTVIDGIGMGSLVNHSCRPNCRVVEEQARLFFITRRNIAAGEELTIDYKLGNSNENEMPCHCGSANCRGTMYSKREMAIRRERAEAEQKAEADARDKKKPVPRASRVPVRINRSLVHSLRKEIGRPGRVNTSTS
jgi:hypothetical protein